MNLILKLVYSYLTENNSIDTIVDAVSSAFNLVSIYDVVLAKDSSTQYTNIIQIYMLTYSNAHLLTYIL